VAPPPPGDVNTLAPNVISVKHGDRLLGGLLYATQPRVDWASPAAHRAGEEQRECRGRSSFRSSFPCRSLGRHRAGSTLTEEPPREMGVPSEEPSHFVSSTNAVAPAAAAGTLAVPCCDGLRAFFPGLELLRRRAAPSRGMNHLSAGKLKFASGSAPG
jgi:hypothetical protein